MNRYSEQDSGSDTSFEDNQSTGPLLPVGYQSWSSTPEKEIFQLPPLTPTLSSSDMAWSPRSWTGPRFHLPFSARRRFVLLVALGLITLASIPLFMTGRLSSPRDLTRVDGSSSQAEASVQSGENAAMEELEPIDGAQEESLPIRLRPETYLEGWESTMHFRGMLCHPRFRLSGPRREGLARLTSRYSQIVFEMIRAI